MTTEIIPFTEIDLYQTQLISSINAELSMKQQQILSKNLSRRDFTAYLKTTLATIREFEPLT